jgi:hypothetical protein
MLKGAFGMSSRSILSERELTGVRLYDERVHVEPDYSAKGPSKGDNFDSRTLKSSGSSEDETEQVELLHSPPGYWMSRLGK